MEPPTSFEIVTKEQCNHKLSIVKLYLKIKQLFRKSGRRTYTLTTRIRRVFQYVCSTSPDYIKCFQASLITIELGFLPRNFESIHMHTGPEMVILIS